MNFINDLADLQKESDPTAKLIASKIKIINDTLAAGSITKAEAIDLLNDLDVATQIAGMAADLETKILAQKVVDGFIEILELMV
jgi:hypothetical protein